MGVGDRRVRGVNLVLVARRANVLETKATEVREEHGVEVRTLSVDITSPDLLERLDEVTHDLEVGMLGAQRRLDRARITAGSSTTRSTSP